MSPPTKESCALALSIDLSGLQVVGDMLVAFSRWLTKNSHAIVVMFPNYSASVLLRLPQNSFHSRASQR
jgi:hypothetical protein